MSLETQAIHELATLGRLTPETDYDVRDELGLVSDEERDAHEAAEEASKPPETKPVSTVKPKGN